MNEDIEKIIKYFKNDAWFTIFNAEECNDEPYKLLNPIEVNQIIDYMTKLQNNWNELKKFVKEEQAKISKNCGTKTYINKISPYIIFSDKMQELEQGKDE